MGVSSACDRVAAQISKMLGICTYKQRLFWLRNCDLPCTSPARHMLNALP